MYKKISKFLVIITIFLLGINNVNAAGYTISLSSSNPTKGKTVTLYIKGTDIAGGFNISSSDATVASVSNSPIWVEDNTVTVSISTYKAGSATITVTPTSVANTNCSDINCDISLPTKTLTVNVKNENTSKKQNNTQIKKNNDATLKSLSIEGFNINPEFKNDVLEYNVEVPAGTEKVKINATQNDNKANINGIGEIKVSEGANKLDIIVTAEDGTTKTYTINVNVKELEPIKIKIDKEEYTVIRKEEDLPEIELFEISKLNIGKEEVIGYYNEKLNIYLIGLKDKNGNTGLYVYNQKKKSYTEYKWITVGGVTLQLKQSAKNKVNFKQYDITINNTKVNIYKLNKNSKLGLIYGTNIMTNNTGWYIYDKEEETLARYYDEESIFYKNKVEKYKNYLMIFIGISSALIIIVVIVSLLKSRKKQRKFNR